MGKEWESARSKQKSVVASVVTSWAVGCKRCGQKVGWGTEAMWTVVWVWSRDDGDAGTDPSAIVELVRTTLGTRISAKQK